MKKKFIFLIFLLLPLSIISSPKKNIAQFKHKESNPDNYIHISKLGAFFPEEVMFAFASKGPALTLGVEIKTPYEREIHGGWYHTSKLSNYPYNNWANDRKKEIVSTLENRTRQGILPKSNTNFSKKNEPNYFIRNKVSFGGTYNETFVDNQGLHIFVAICNNAHVIEQPKKIDIRKEKNLNIEAIVKFKGNATMRDWRTYYKQNIDFYNDRYYVTTAYVYDKHNEKYIQTTRGSWYFYNADLIIVDLGTTGHMEDSPMNWRVNKQFGYYKYVLFNNMKKPHYGEVDDEARITKATYHIKFTPSWDNTKTLKQSILLGKD